MEVATDSKENELVVTRERFDLLSWGGFITLKISELAEKTKHMSAGELPRFNLGSCSALSPLVPDDLPRSTLS